MNMSQESTVLQLKALRDSFREQLPGRIAKVEAVWREVADHGWDDQSVMRLRHLLHSLTGAAGTFGFVEFSGAARALERAIDGVQTNAGKPLQSTLLHLSGLLCELRDIAVIEEPSRLKMASVMSNAVRGLIYLVDDDPEFSADTMLQLGNFGYEVRCFSVLGEFLAAVRTQRPAAVLLDVMFGSSSGITVFDELRRVCADLPPVVFVSTRDDFAARLGAVRAGCSGYFSKPVDIGLLIDRMDRLTGIHQVEPCRVLIVDDSEPEAQAHSLYLRQAGFNTEIITDPMKVVSELENFMPDLILIDMAMPVCNGQELAAVIRQKDAYAGIPIVFLSAETDRDRQMSAMKDGGDDFLVKPIRPGHLVASLQARAERGRMLRSLMVRDSLTGLLNHNSAKERLVAEVARAGRYRSELSIAMIDIDHFKKINDKFGHPVGDRVIKSLARQLQQRVRSTDIIGRYGGEEFILLLVGTGAERAVQILDGIREIFGGIRHRAVDADFTATISCGIASFPAADTCETLLDAADQALYAAKKAGRNRVCVSQLSQAPSGVALLGTG